MTDSEPMELNDPKDTHDAVFEFEADGPSSPDLSARVLEAHRVTDEKSNSVFGLDEEDGESATASLTLDEGAPEEGIIAKGTKGLSLEKSDDQGNQAQKNRSGDDTDTPLILDMGEAKRIIETLLFATHEPLRPRDISMVFRGVENVNAKVVRKLLAELMEEYESRTLQIAEVAEGFRMCTRLEFSLWVRRFLKQDRKWRVSNAGLEALAIIAYKQPITKMEIEEIRRVDCSGVIHTLLERMMIRVLGRRDVIGKPIVYGTTSQFLEHFGFKSLTDLPNPEELDLDINFEETARIGDLTPIENKINNQEDSAHSKKETREAHTTEHSSGTSNGQVDASVNGHANDGESGLGNFNSTDTGEKTGLTEDS